MSDSPLATTAAAGAPRPTLLRPPYGSVGDTVKQTAGMPFIMWRVDPEDWEQELIDIKEFFQKFGDRLPRELNVEHENLSRRLAPSQVAR